MESATTAAGALAGNRPLRKDVLRNRDAILASAERAFAERGPATSLEDIARDAGVGSATLHRHFPTREVLIAAVYRRQIEDLCASAGDLLARHPADEALAEWLRLFVSHVLARPGMATAIKAAACQTRELGDIRATLRSAVTRLAAPAVIRGMIRPDITADDILRALAAVCLFDDQPAAHAQAIRLIDLFTDGLRYGAQQHSGVFGSGKADDEDCAGLPGLHQVGRGECGVGVPRGCPGAGDGDEGDGVGGDPVPAKDYLHRYFFTR